MIQNKHVKCKEKKFVSYLGSDVIEHVWKNQKIKAIYIYNKNKKIIKMRKL